VVGDTTIAVEVVVVVEEEDMQVVIIATKHRNAQCHLWHHPISRRFPNQANLYMYTITANPTKNCFVLLMMIL